MRYTINSQASIFQAGFCKLLLVFLFSSFLFPDVLGAEKIFTGPGNFSDATKWDMSALPSAGDNLTINGSCTVDNNVSTDNVEYGTLIIGGSSAGTLNWIASGINRLNVSSISSSVAASNLDMTNGGSLIIGGTGLPPI